MSKHLTTFVILNPVLMEERTATVIGATGLIGSQLVGLLQKDDYFKKIRIIARRSVSFNNPEIEIRIINFADEAAFRSAVEGSDAVFCAVGTTNRKVRGDKSEYRKVDYEIPVHAAEYCAETGCVRFLLVSSVGANARSGNFYLRMKGEVEGAVKDMNIQSVSIFRPSMLLGDREEFRAGETLGKALAIPFSFLVPSIYKPVHGITVARAMIGASKQSKPGFHIYHYNEIISLAGLNT